ncbi:MAG TPA: ATP-binding protein [Rhodocyclaceae bacterium]|nr:ATP-binding protein [Rhodocyclaceae bacterium]
MNRPTTQGSNRIGRFRNRIAAPWFVALIVAAIVGQTGWAIRQDRQLTLESEKDNGLVAVRLLEEHASQTLQDAIRRLDLLAAEIQSMIQTTDDPQTALRNVIATHRLQETGYLKALQYIDPKGMSWIASPDYPAHRVDLRERSYVRYLIDHPGNTQAFIGHPYPSRYDSQLAIPVAKNLYDLQGKHLGVISVDIRVSYFGGVYGRVAKANRASLALIADEGFVIVRSPFEARYADRDLTDSPMLAWLRSAPDEGAFIDSSFLDDETARFYIYRKVPGFPIATVYGRDIDSMYSAWSDRTRDRLLISCATIALLVALTWLLQMHIRRLRASRESLRESEAKFVGLFQQSPVPLALVRQHDGEIIEINNAWQQQFGYARDEVVGHSVAEIHLWVDLVQKETLKWRLVRQRFLDRCDVMLRHKDGRNIVCLVSAQVFVSKGDEQVIFNAIDVTRQREIEHEIRELNSQLEERVKNRTENLEQTNRELSTALASLKTMQNELIRSEKLAALGSLVAGVAHELNTPIGTGVTVASMLQDQTRDISNEFVTGKMRRSALESFLRNTTEGTRILMNTLHRAAELVSSFKGVAVDQASNQRRRFDLNRVLHEIDTMLQPMCKKTPYRLIFDEAPEIEFDSYPGALSQVLTNFVTNALLHAFEGREHGEMRLCARALDDERVEIAFSDDGIGIAENIVGRVFDPFFTTKLGQGGSGLGMHIVYNIVTEVLGGRIHIDSTVGLGTRISVIIPRKP